MWKVVGEMEQNKVSNINPHQVNFSPSFCSDIVWQDLAFFNADLFDGLSRMIIDSVDPTLSEEAFQSTYCCHFEVCLYADEEVHLHLHADADETTVACK